MGCTVSHVISGGKRRETPCMAYLGRHCSPPSCLLQCSCAVPCCVGVTATGLGGSPKHPPPHTHSPVPFPCNPTHDTPHRTPQQVLGFCMASQLRWQSWSLASWVAAWAAWWVRSSRVSLSMQRRRGLLSSWSAPVAVHACRCVCVRMSACIQVSLDLGAYCCMPCVCSSACLSVSACVCRSVCLPSACTPIPSTTTDDVTAAAQCGGVHCQEALPFLLTTRMC